MNTKIKAIVLVSGGLDSTLAAALMKEQGLTLVALNVKTPFCLCNRKSSHGCLSHAQMVTHNLGIELKVINVTEEFFSVLRKPRHGYGSNMNPCIDCRILLFKKAKELMHQEQASFVITGEVLGQRPMSQHKVALKVIDKESGLEGLVLRPLSAQLLPETLPEKEGLVNRSKLLDLGGRSRRRQMDLAASFNIKDYPCPAGGCLLTDPSFAVRLKDLLAHGELNVNSVELLKIGRHFRLDPNTKLIVGRNEKENSRLVNLAQDNDYLFFPGAQMPGPTALGRGIFNGALIKISCALAGCYCDINGSPNVAIIYKRMPADEGKKLEVMPLSRADLNALRI